MFAHPRVVPHAPARLIPLRGGEIELVRPVFDALSAQSRWLRFHNGMPRIPERYLTHLARVQPGERQVLVAVLDGIPVGHGEWTRDRDDPSLADIALAVADAAQGRGIGMSLAAHLAEGAARVGIEHFVCHTLAGNAPVRRWLQRLGAISRPGDGTEFHIDVEALRSAMRRAPATPLIASTACA